MFETIGFLLFLMLTVIALVMTLISGVRKQRHAHLWRAITTVVFLCITIVFAFWLGEVRKFPEAEMDIHKIFSRTAAYMVPPLVLTGVMLWRSNAWRWAHRACIAVFLVGVLGAAGTGLWVFWLSTPIG